VAPRETETESVAVGKYTDTAPIICGHPFDDHETAGDALVDLLTG